MLLIRPVSTGSSSEGGLEKDLGLPNRSQLTDSSEEDFEISIGKFRLNSSIAFSVS